MSPQDRPDGGSRSAQPEANPVNASGPAVLGALRDWRRQAAADSQVAALVQQPPSAWAGLSQTALQWMLIAAAVIAAQVVQAWPVTLLAVVFVGSRQHALLVLMHDASHYLLARSRRVNDQLSDLFLAFPLLVSTACYREHHLAHHQYLNTPQDPDYADAFAPASRRLLWWLLLQDLSGLSTMKSLRSVNQFGVSALWRPSEDPSKQAAKTAGRTRFIGFAMLVTAVAVATHGGGLLLVYWLAPMVFVLPLILRMRSLGEHGGLLPECRSRPARSIATGPLERLLIAPCSIGRHLEHHLFPKVPNYRLEHLSRRLRGLRGGTPRQTQGYVFGPRSLLAELYTNAPGQS